MDEKVIFSESLCVQRFGQSGQFSRIMAPGKKLIWWCNNLVLPYQRHLTDRRSTGGGQHRPSLHALLLWSPAGHLERSEEKNWPFLITVKDLPFFSCWLGKYSKEMEKVTSDSILALWRKTGDLQERTTFSKMYIHCKATVLIYWCYPAPCGPGI